MICYILETYLENYIYSVQITYNDHDVTLTMGMQIINDIWQSCKFTIRVIRPIQMLMHVVDVIPLGVLKFISPSVS